MTQRLTPAEAAEHLRRSPETLRYWRHRNEGPKFVREGRRIFYLTSVLDEWTESLIVTPKYQ